MSEIIGIVVLMVFMYMVGSSEGRVENEKKFQQELVDKGYAEYNSQNKEFQYINLDLICKEKVELVN